MVKRASEQMEFTKFPERSPLGKKAIEYLNLKDKIARMEGELDTIKIELIEEFRECGMAKIRVEGQTISYLHSEKDKLVVKKKPAEIQ